MALLECAAAQLHTGRRLSGADDADGCHGGDGGDDVGPPCTFLKTLRGIQQSETEVNHFIYLFLSLPVLSLNQV